MSENKHLTPVFIVYADGRRLDLAHEGALQTVTVDDRLNGIGAFTLVFNTAELGEQSIIAQGSVVSIHLGYKDDIEELFSGEALYFRKMQPDNGPEQIEIKGSNALYKLLCGSRFRSFENKKTSDVIKGLIDSYSLSAEADDFGAPKEFQTEESMTDYEYLIQQANAYGKQVYADGSTIYVKNEISIRSDEIIYEWGKSLVSFESAVNIAGLAAGADYSGWDQGKNESFAGSAELGDLPVKIGGAEDWSALAPGGANAPESRMNLAAKDGDEAEQLALGKLQSNSYNFITAHGGGEGNYKLRPGMRVTVKMVGEDYEGEYMAEEVTHKIDRRGGYTSEFTLKRNMRP